MYLHIEDDFLPNVKEVREQALKLPFDGVDYQGHFYPGIDLPDDDLFDSKALIEKAIGKKIIRKMEFFRLSKPGEESPAYIHADEICASMASVLYLTDSDVGGTAFWRHNKSGMLALDNETDRTQFIEDANNQSKWDQTLELKFKLNRFVTYPTNYFHSRWPFKSEGFGNAKKTARLIWVCFYDLV